MSNINSDIKKILIIKQTSLGDVLHATAFIREISLLYPNAKIHIVTDKSALQILENNPHINKFYVLNIYKYEKEILKSVKDFCSTIKAFFSVVSDVKKERYDLAFDLQGLERSVIFLYLCHAKRKFVKGKKWLGLKRKDFKDVHAIRILLSLLEFIGHKTENTKLDFYLPNDIQKTYEQTLKDNNIVLSKKYIVISAFSRWTTKDLQTSKIIEIIKSIKENISMQNIDIVLTSTKAEHDKCMEVANAFDKDNSIHVLAGVLNIKTLAFLIKNASAMISVDSFPMHIASSFETPLVGLFGATSEIRVGPISKNSTVVRASNIECQKCYIRKDCPNNYKCMNNLDSNEIVAILEKYI